MGQKIGDRIRAERDRQFVGRESELNLFRSFIDADELPVSVLQVYGPGGVGKTTLVKRWEADCAARGIPTLTLDGRNLKPIPDVVLNALALVSGHPSSDQALAHLAELPKAVLFFDTFEAIDPLDGWLRDSFVPDLPSTVLVVIVGRNRPTSAWRSDVWQQLARIVNLRNLSADESRSYLSGFNVTPDAQDHIIQFTHGFPLALSLFAETYTQSGRTDMRAESAPHIVSVLLERLMEGVDDPVKREVLEICALVRMCSEALIANVVNRPRAAELFAWLRGLSFVETTALGLMPHDLAREAIAHELQWRNPERYSELHHRTRSYYSGLLDRASGATQQQILFDYIYLHRDSPVVRPFFNWHSQPASYQDVARPEDLPEILRLVEKNEGPQSVALVKKWFEIQPLSFTVFRSSIQPGHLDGLMVTLVLGDQDYSAVGDPAVDAAIAHIKKVAPMRETDRSIYFRFWMADEGYQDVSPIQSVIFVSMVQIELTTPHLAFVLIPCAQPEFWSPMFAYAMQPRVHDTDFTVDGHLYGVFALDWRAISTKKWLALLGEREVPLKESEYIQRPAQDVMVLSQNGFAEAVQDALRGFNNDIVLSQNPLLRSRLVLEYPETSSDVRTHLAAIRQIVRTAVDRLDANAKDAKLYEALGACYLKPMRSQEVAAEALDVSIATLRRHLKSGVSRVVDHLWQLEIAT